jgi:UDP-N-acetylglucosamine--N-acetylmuramyl-(pentapeptide) pyrophosphoryl-undecaprenol N-acetylglucosamine transferase
MTNKILARFVESVFISLDESAKFFPEELTLLTGNPVRKEILNSLSAPLPLDKAGSGSFSLLIFGGSAGAHSVNKAVIGALPHLRGRRERLTIIHQTGVNDLEEVRDAYRQEDFAATAVPFIDDMAAAYRSASLVVCRAGATTIAEVTVSGKACIFIPYPHAVDDHQRRNAEALLKREAGFMLLERELSGESLARQIGELMDNPAQLVAAGENARKLARSDAAQAIVDEMLKM